MLPLDLLSGLLVRLFFLLFSSNISDYGEKLYFINNFSLEEGLSSFIIGEGDLSIGSKGGVSAKFLPIWIYSGSLSGEEWFSKDYIGEDLVLSETCFGMTSDFFSVCLAFGFLLNF